MLNGISVSSWARRAREAALDAVFPIRCLGCGRFGKFICPSCVRSLPVLRNPHCALCAAPQVNGTCAWCQERRPATDAVHSPYLYIADSPIRRAITALKYGGITAIAPELADLLTDFVLDQQIQFDVIAPVVSHRSRVRQRGYSQASLIAESIARRLDARIIQNALIRDSSAPSQLSADSRSDRWANVQDGFTASKGLDLELSGKAVLLVDDLVTTGSTAHACSTALKHEGAAKVVCVSVARTP